MISFEELTEFVHKQTAFGGLLTPTTSLQIDIGMYGIDVDDFMEAYATRFNVDLSEYRWYFLTGEEGFSPGGLLFPPPNARVPEIPLTLQLLFDSAQAGRWLLQYPEHQLPRYRLDTLINQVIVLTSLAAFIVFGIRSCNG